MAEVALYVHFTAKPGKEQAVADLLLSAPSLVDNEPGTVSWYAVQEGPAEFSIFDTFDDEEGRDAHLNGQVAKALLDRADELLVEPPAIHKLDILASKTPL